MQQSNNHNIHMTIWLNKTKKKKKKKTRFFMFFTLIFGDNFFIIEFSKLCSR